MKLPNRLAFAFVLGVILSLSYLCRPTFLVWAAMLLLCTLLTKESIRDRLIVATFIAIPIVGSVGLWMIRNQSAVGKPVWATTHGGYTLLLANNPSFYGYLRSGRFGFAWDANEFFTGHEHRYNGNPSTVEFWETDWSETPVKAPEQLSETVDDRLCYDAAVATIRRQPGQFAWSCFVRFARLWSPFPHKTTDRSWIPIILVGAIYGVLYLAIAIGIWKLGSQVLRSRWWPVWALAASLSCVHAIYWSNLRMRAPFIPAMAILAAASLIPKQKNPSV